MNRILMLAKIRYRLLSLKIRWLASRYLIGGKYRRVYHYHIRKSAGTSLNSAFWNLAGLDMRKMKRQARVCRNGLVFVRYQRVLIEQGHYFYASSHHPAHTLQLPKDTFTITILRNPLDRVLSHYRYLLWARDNPLAHEQEPYLKELEQEIGWLGNSFGDFLDQIPREHLLRQLFMFSKDYNIKEALERVLACSAVCFTMRFSQDLRRLGQQLHLLLHERHERRFVHEISLSPGEMNRAREILDPEFLLLEQVSRELSDQVSAEA